MANYFKIMSDKVKVGDFVNWPEAPNQFRKNKGGKVIKIKDGIAFIEGYIDGIIKKVPIKILTKL